MFVINYQEVVPPLKRDRIKISTQEELVFLGIENLLWIQSEWRIWQDVETKKLDGLNKKLEELEETPELSSEGLKKMLSENTKREVAEQQKKIDRIEVIIDLITDATVLAENKPILPCARKRGHFIRDEYLVVFDDGKFLNAEVVSEEMPAKDRPLIVFIRDGRARAYNDISPTIMKRSEFEYLEHHPEYTKIWIKSAGWFPEEMLEAFAERYPD
ncbi:hypothetical protein IKF33_00120 [Candidatus Saccharibacteria bacterium]|nr:hypothetical protein [Candidatus Saccharibacteria bacterium]